MAFSFLPKWFISWWWEGCRKLWWICTETSFWRVQMSHRGQSDRCFWMWINMSLISICCHFLFPWWKLLMCDNENILEKKKLVFLFLAVHPGTVRWVRSDHEVGPGASGRVGAEGQQVADLQPLEEGPVVRAVRYETYVNILIYFFSFSSNMCLESSSTDKEQSRVCGYKSGYKSINIVKYGNTWSSIYKQIQQSILMQLNQL